MEFDEIKTEVKKARPDTTRIDDDKYFEAVIARARLEETTRVLETIFGAPVWPSKNKLSKDTERLIKNVGGLRKGQTLYCMNNGNECLAFAMLWPWQDGERITIKISRV